MRRRGQGQDLAELREYVAGDDLRHLDPASTARTGVPHVRVWEQERDRTVMLVADFRSHMLWGRRRALRSVAAAEALSLCGWYAVEAGNRVAALVIGAGGSDGTPPRGRRHGMLAAIGALCRGHDRALRDAARAVERDEKGGLTEGISQLDRLAPSGALILLASALDDAGEGFDRALAGLIRRRSVCVLRIEEGTALPAGQYRIAGPGGWREWQVGEGTQLASRAAALPEGATSLQIDPREPPGRMAARIAAAGMI